MYDVKVDGKSVVNVENTKPEQFGPVKVFAGSDWHPNLEGQIKNLNVVTKPEGNNNVLLLLLSAKNPSIKTKFSEAKMQVKSHFCNFIFIISR